MNEFTYAALINIAAGVVASAIFWLLFVHLPASHRRGKLRPKLDLGIYQVYRTLFAIFDLIMRFSATSPSAFQKKISGGKLSLDDLELGLQNKCLNETFLYDPNVTQFLLVVGKRLFELITAIDQATQRVFEFSNYLTTGEILLLEQIRGKLRNSGFEDYSRPATTHISGAQYAPCNPSLWYMADNFCELYELFCKLRTLVFKNKYEDREVLLDKVRCYCEQGAYARCRRSIRIARKKLPSDRTWLEFYAFRCEYMSGNGAAARRKLNGILAAKPHLVSARAFLADIMADSSLRRIIEKHYTETEIAEFDSAVREETQIHAQFAAQANKLKRHYLERAHAVLNKSGA